MTRVRTRKTCSSCGEEKTLAAFNKREMSPDGYRGVCRQCQKEDNRRRRGNGVYKTLDEIMDAIDITTLLARDMERFRVENHTREVESHD